MKGFRDKVLFANKDWGTLLCESFLGSQCDVDSHIVMVISCATSTMHLHFPGVFPPCQLHLLHALASQLPRVSRVTDLASRYSRSTASVRLGHREGALA